MKFEFDETFQLGKNKIPVKIRASWFAEEGELPCYLIHILVMAEEEFRDNTDLRGSKIQPSELADILEFMDQPEWPSTKEWKIKVGKVDSHDLKIIVDLLHDHAIASYSPNWSE